MVASLTTLGVAATVAAVTLLVLGTWSRPRARPYPPYGYAGWALLLAGELLLFRALEPVPTYFTPIAWTGYLLAVDAAVFALRGRSRLCSTPREFAWMAFCSVPLWLLFEAYNWRLQNWMYVGMPEPLWEQALGSTWAFATIIPALLETADLVAALGWFEKASARGWRFFLRQRRVVMWVGAAFLAVPLLVPVRWAAYLFALVWLGFALLLEPVNYARGHDSLLRDLEQNHGQRLYALFCAGLICGLLWEFWNYWAGARWVYIFPIFQKVKMFEMPLLGYLGFPPFAVECFALWSVAWGEMRRLRGEPQMRQGTASAVPEGGQKKVGFSP
ncbi:MAG: hypothetical protein HY656_07830 [Acidobacteria bacterium]|nr:hypothetical protein [Acidobacteriota bacterium]